jgi:hypothetical protein
MTEIPLPPLSSPMIEAENIDKARLAAGSGFLGMTSVKRITVTGNNADPVTVNNQLTVPAGTTRAVLSFNMVNMGFGHGTIIEGPFARFAFQVAANTLSGTVLTFKVWAYFRNANNGNAWEATIDVSAFCFG